MILHSGYNMLRIKKAFALEDNAARLIAVHADGGLRDALSILDQCVGSGQRRDYTGRCRGTHWPR